MNAVRRFKEAQEYEKLVQQFNREEAKYLKDLAAYEKARDRGEDGLERPSPPPMPREMQDRLRAIQERAVKNSLRKQGLKIIAAAGAAGAAGRMMERKEGREAEPLLPAANAKRMANELAVELAVANYYEKLVKGTTLVGEPIGNHPIMSRIIKEIFVKEQENNRDLLEGVRQAIINSRGPPPPGFTDENIHNFLKERYKSTQPKAAAAAAGLPSDAPCRPGSRVPRIVRSGAARPARRSGRTARPWPALSSGSRCGSCRRTTA